MKIYTPDLKKLEELVEKGYLKKQTHPTLPLTIWNYTHVAQFEGYWTEDTLNCRGLVTDDKGIVIARPFPKFFNDSELQYKFPDEPFEVFEKMDGSLGLVFWYGTELVFASRGSFTSDQAVEAKKIWEENKMDIRGIIPGWTFLFEIIYPENRIVCDYGSKRALVLLAVVETNTGNEQHPIYAHEFEAVKSYSFNSMDELLKADPLENSEGYVVKFQSGLRVKIKFEEYKRLHKLITEASNISIWETLANGDDIEHLLEKVPDEFYNWVRETKTKLESQFKEIEDLAKHWYGKLMAQKFHNRKDNANFIINSTPKKVHGILFKMLDGAEYSEIIWKQIRPQYEKPLWQRNQNEV